ncbi:hypothetical protein [Halorussus marinus]|uniref:hypothetical protein n=1 Tax=Halorussus marinus TaxID=2505976 RepID=UPI00143CD11A|nr:hypothetical protein [Halorussus marinus]
MSDAIEPLAVLVGTTLTSYAVWKLAFGPFEGPLPGRVLPLFVLGTALIAGLGLGAWGLDRLDLLGRP